MDLSKIISVPGKGGLFRLVSQIRNGILVESLNDSTRMPVYSSQPVSSLEEISLFTIAEDLPLKKVFQSIYSKLDGKEAISHKSSNEELKAFMESVIPDYDKERVYVSDIRKLVNWYNILLGEGLIDLEEDKDDEDDKGGNEAGESES
jgi:hypothetical protein